VDCELSKSVLFKVWILLRITRVFLPFEQAVMGMSREERLVARWDDPRFFDNLQGLKGRFRDGGRLSRQMPEMEWKWPWWTSVAIIHWLPRNVCDRVNLNMRMRNNPIVSWAMLIDRESYPAPIIALSHCQGRISSPVIGFIHWKSQ
jgi:hypothetical protein